MFNDVLEVSFDIFSLIVSMSDGDLKIDIIYLSYTLYFIWDEFAIVIWMYNFDDDSESIAILSYNIGFPSWLGVLDMLSFQPSYL